MTAIDTAKDAIEAARGWYVNLKREQVEPCTAVDEIRRLLHLAGATSDVLEPSGRKSAKEINRYLDTVGSDAKKENRDATLSAARAEYQDFLDRVDRNEVSGAVIDSVNMIRRFLRRAGSSAAALDPRGALSAQEIERQLDDALRGSLTEVFRASMDLSEGRIRNSLRVPLGRALEARPRHR